MDNTRGPGGSKDDDLELDFDDGGAGEGGGSVDRAAAGAAAADSDSYIPSPFGPRLRDDGDDGAAEHAVAASAASSSGPAAGPAKFHVKVGSRAPAGDAVPEEAPRLRGIRGGGRGGRKDPSVGHTDFFRVGELSDALSDAEVDALREGAAAEGGSVLGWPPAAPAVAGDTASDDAGTDWDWGVDSRDRDVVAPDDDGGATPWVLEPRTQREKQLAAEAEERSAAALAAAKNAAPRGPLRTPPPDAPSEEEGFGSATNEWFERQGHGKDASEGGQEDDKQQQHERQSHTARNVAIGCLLLAGAVATTVYYRQQLSSWLEEAGIMGGSNKPAAAGNAEPAAAQEAAPSEPPAAASKTGLPDDCRIDVVAGRGFKAHCDDPRIEDLNLVGLEGYAKVSSGGEEKRIKGLLMVGGKTRFGADFSIRCPVDMPRPTPDQVRDGVQGYVAGIMDCDVLR